MLLLTRSFQSTAADSSLLPDGLCMHAQWTLILSSRPTAKKDVRLMLHYKDGVMVLPAGHGSEVQAVPLQGEFYCKAGEVWGSERHGCAKQGRRRRTLEGVERRRRKRW